MRLLKFMSKKVFSTIFEFSRHCSSQQLMPKSAMVSVAPFFRYFRSYWISQDQNNDKIFDKKSVNVMRNEVYCLGEAKNQLLLASNWQSLKSSFSLSMQQQSLVFMYCDVELQYSYSLVIQCSQNRIDLTVVWKSEGDMGIKDIITTSHSQISIQLAMKNATRI